MHAMLEGGCNPECPLRPLQGSRVPKPLVLVPATLVSLLLAEAGDRIQCSLRGTTCRATAREAQPDQRVDALHGAKLMPEAAQASLLESGTAVHPCRGYPIGWQTRQGQEFVRDFAGPDAQASFDIAPIGGSVAASIGKLAGNLLLPTLQRNLRLAGRRIRLNYVACPGHTQTQHTMSLQWLLSRG